MTSCSASVWNKQVEDDDDDDVVREVGVVSDPAFFGKRGKSKYGRTVGNTH